MATQPISADFPYTSQYVDIHGSQIHYVEEGSGDPIVFLHGNPTSSYLWRNIMPHLHAHGRCIAMDLKWCQQNLSNLKVVDIGPGIYFIQEDNPHLIGTELANWYSSL